jgi:hypothetical protein
MIEITNRQKGPVQIVIRSRKHLNSFTTKNIPGIGSGNNVYELADELMTEYVERVKQAGLISTKYVKNKVITEGE